jgi:hypothetical protein
MWVVRLINQTGVGQAPEYGRSFVVLKIFPAMFTRWQEAVDLAARKG